MLTCFWVLKNNYFFSKNKWIACNSIVFIALGRVLLCESVSVFICISVVDEWQHEFSGFWTWCILWPTGTCHCGSCMCHNPNGKGLISGRYCECDDSECLDEDSGEMCGGMTTVWPVLLDSSTVVPKKYLHTFILLYYFTPYYIEWHLIVFLTWNTQNGGFMQMRWLAW